MKNVFRIYEYNLKGAHLFTYETYQLNEGESMEKYKNNKNIVLSETPKGYNKKENEFLPYVADVTEDLPGYLKFKPKTYKGCKLMSETHGSYLQFYHEETKQVLRIATNSHYYTPSN